jgi:3-hydroxyisobutyrate dehydrogenase-like beta-hydroxyacid dehydrogenase
VIGEDAASANLVKLAANVLTATTLECMGEVLALMRKGGVDGHLAFDVLTNSLFDSRVHKSYGQKIVDGRYTPPGLTAPLAIKDLRLALVEAERAAVPMPAAALVHDASSRWWPAVGWTSTGPPWGCLRPSMLALTTAGPSTRRPKLACGGKSQGRHLGLV